MENTLRIIITIFFVGLIALAIILFGVFGLAPLGQVGKNKTPKVSEEIVLNDGKSETSKNIDLENEKTKEGPTSSVPVIENTIPTENKVNQTPPPTPVVTPPPVKRDVRLDVPAGSPDAPQQSAPISPSSLPTGTPQIIAKDGKLTPQYFAVREGEEITLAFTSGDKRTHILTFDSEVLMAVAIGVGPDETRTMKFKVPKAGMYTFTCSVPGHAGAGETGTMTVIK
ncbi:MAG: cupredoxin domain-containing protein [Patescibacteria group bacterium]